MHIYKPQQPLCAHARAAVSRPCGFIIYGVYQYERVSLW